MKNKRLILPVILATLCFSSGLMADSLISQVKVNLRKDVEVTKSYQKQGLYDGKGTRIYPLMYNGTLYLPIRSVGSLTNSEVTWDGTNKRVNVEPKVNVQYVQIPIPCDHKDTDKDSNSNNTSSIYDKLSSSDKRKVDDYEDKIKTYEKKLDDLEDDLDDLYDEEDYLEDKYDRTGQQSYKDKLKDIRDDIDDCKEDIKDLKNDIKNYKSKIDTIYEKYE